MSISIIQLGAVFQSLLFMSVGPHPSVIRKLADFVTRNIHSGLVYVPLNKSFLATEGTRLGSKVVLFFLVFSNLLLNNDCSSLILGVSRDF